MDDKNQNQFNFCIRKFIQLLLLFISSALYLLLDFHVYDTSQINYYLFIIIPLYIIYFYFIFITLNHSNIKSITWTWFLGFGLIIRLLFINNVPLHGNEFFYIVLRENFHFHIFYFFKN